MRLLWVLLLAAGAIAAPRLARRELECRGPNRFSNRVFTYNYEGETVSGIVGSSSARSALRIRARVVVKPVGGCQHSLKIDSTELWESQSESKTLGYTKSEKSPAFAVELEAHELVFSTTNGAITDLLPHAEESTRTLNIKRGILSTLQAKIIRDNATVDEVDVSGECSAQYAVHSRYISRLPKVISKSKDLTNCSGHAQTNVGIHAHTYDEKSISLLRSTSNCRFALTAKNLIRHVVCQEEHLFRPFSAGYNSSSGAITTTKQVLKLLNIERSVEYPPTMDLEAERKTLKYEHEDKRSTEFDIKEVKSTLVRLARESMKMTRPESARLFSHLVKSIRKLNVKAMELVWNLVFECDKEGLCEEDEVTKFQTYLLDALPHCGSEGCARVMSYAIKNELVNNERSNLFLAGIALVTVPTEKVLSDLLMLVKTNPSRTGMLTLGTLMHKFCETRPQCEESPIVTLADQWLQSRLGERCEAETADEAEEILLTLKAIGNAGRPVSAQGILMQCALNGNAPINVSIAALEATRRMPSSEQLTEDLLSIYAEPNVDVEIRLAAYLALMNCPSPDVFKRIAEIQKREVNNQVGSFVWSHLTNAMESTEPVHGASLADMIKDALKGSELREFNLNRLRFSRAWEGSFYSDVLRAGGSAQGHLIFHPNSYFPRSARLNLTADILGASINVLETAARFEGFEILIEQMFGKDGYYPDDRIMKLFDLQTPEERDADEKLAWNVRGRRSLSDDINNVEKHLTKLHQKMDKYQHHPTGAVSVKVFGNEMRLISFDDISWLQSEADNVNMVDMLIQLARGGKKTFTKSFMFLDADTTIPTILGLPLKLHAEGSAVASLELQGKFDIRNMFWGPMSFDVRGHIKPSANVEITGRMGVDAGFAEAGILVNSSLYTSTQVKGNATYKQGDTLRFEVAAPETPMQIVNISSSLYTTLNGIEVSVDGGRRVKPAPCFNMTRVLGLSACGQLSFPLAFRDYESPFFPLSGPSSFALSIERTDPKLRVYQILAIRKPTEDENEYDIITRISTPNATWEREFEVNASLRLKKEEKIFGASMGALGLKLGKIDGWYNNVTHAANLTFSTRDAIYGYPVVLSGQIFNNSDPEKAERELGLKWFVTFKNYTLKHLTKVYNRSWTYGYVSNTSDWRGMYLYSAGELSVPKKTVAFLANHTCTNTSIRFDGSLGEEENNFVFNFTNKPSNVSIRVGGDYLKKKREAVLKMFVKPCRQSFTLRGSFAESGLEKGVHFMASHDNKNRVLTWYTGILNATTEKAIKTNATLLGRPLQVVWTYFNVTTEKGVRFNASALDKSIGAVFSYINLGQEKSVKFNASALNKTLMAAWTFVNGKDQKILKFNGSALNQTIEAVWTYLGMMNKKALNFNGTVLNRTMQSSWVFEDNGERKVLKMNATALNKTAQASWMLINSPMKKMLAFNATVLNKTAEASWTLVNLAKERSLRFSGKAMNRTVAATWSLVNLERMKGLTFNATALNKTISAAWTLLNFTNEKSLKFNASGLNRTMDVAWTWVSFASQKSLKFNASVLNKTMEVLWNFTNLATRKSLQFDARVLNKTAKVNWTYLSLPNEKGIKFVAAGSCNRSIEATWTFLNMADKKAVKFNATTLNKTVEASWELVNFANEKGLRLKATALNKTVGAAWTYVSLGNEKALKFNASAMNNTVEASWSFVNFTTEKSVSFKARVLNHTVSAAWTFTNLTNEKSVKFNASALNKTLETMWTFVNRTDVKAIEFNATVMNKTVAAVWSYLKKDGERMLKFHANASNNTIEVAFTLMNSTSEKGVRMNATIMRQTFDASLRYFRTLKEMGVRFNASAYNKSVEVLSKMRMEGSERKMITSVAYQNYTFAVAGVFQNLTTHKSFCMHLKALGKTYGEACVSLTNSSSEKSLAANVSAMNWTAEMKNEWFMTKTSCASRFSTKVNKTTMFESWMSLVHTVELRSLRLNATAANQSVDATWYFLNRSEKAIGMNITALDKHMGVELVFFNSKSFKLAAIHLFLNKTLAALSSVTVLNTANSKRFEVRGKVGKYVGEIQNEYRLHDDGRHDLLMVRLLRNGSKALFFDTSRLSYTKKEKRRELLFGYNLKIMGRSFQYGWDAAHENFSTSEELHHSLSLGLTYTTGRRVSLTSTLKNSTKEASLAMSAQYLPGKYMEHRILWVKAQRLIDVDVELLPKVPLSYRITWNTDNGFSIRSVLRAFGKEILNTFDFDKESEEYNGHFEICPVYPVDISGKFSLSNGLLATSTIAAFTRTWSHRIEINKEERKILISIEPIPQTPMVFQAGWESQEGMKISVDMKAFQKSLQWEAMYKKLTKTLTSDLTVLNQKVSLLQALDVETKTLTLQIAALEHTLGFIGRLDWKQYVASAYLTFDDKKAGWILKMEPSSRKMMMNVTLTPTISGQIVGEMPTDKKLQITLQRKFGMNVVNESRLVYDLSPEARHLVLTWNETTVGNVVKKLKFVKMGVMNFTVKCYNRTIKKLANLTKAIDTLVKKIEKEVKPQAMKFYEQVRKYDYKTMLQNTTQMALNMTMRMANLTITRFNRTVRNLPALVRNATELYKNFTKVIYSMNENMTRLYNQLCKNATAFYHKLRTVIIPPIVGNITRHLGNITRDLKAWSQNVTFMVTNITVRGEKIGVTLERIAVKAKQLTKELVNNITIKSSIFGKNLTVQAKKLIKNLTTQAKALMAEIREMEVRGQKLGPLLDRYMVEVRNFTCDFNASCTLKNLTDVAFNLSMQVRRMRVLNKTVEEHMLVLRKDAILLRSQVLMLRNQAVILVRNITELSKNLTKALPKFLRNASIRTIYLVRNLTKDAKNVTIRVRNVTVEAYLAVKNFSGPAVKQLMKISTSLYYRVRPAVLKALTPVVEYTLTLERNVTAFVKPIVKPLVPLAYKVMYQVRNITVRRVPIGVLMDKAANRSVETVIYVLRVVNNTITTNVSAAIDFIKESSQKTPEEIVDITVKTCERFCNFTMDTVNQTFRLSYNLSKQAVMTLNNSVQALNKTLQRVLKMSPDQIVEVSILKAQSIASNVTFEVLNVTKQLRSLNIVGPMRLAWEEMALREKINGLELEAKWMNLVQRVKAVDIKKGVLAFRTSLVNLTTEAQKYLQKVGNVSYHVLNVTRRFVRMNITKEELMKELMAISKEVREISPIGNVTVLSERLWNKTMALYNMTEMYKNMTLNSTLHALDVAKKFSIALYQEHEIDTMKVIEFYKKMAVRVYEDLKAKVEKKVEAFRKDVDAFKVKLAARMETLKQNLTRELMALVQRLRKYENMTYEDVYNLIKKHGLVLYRNITLKVMKLCNETRNMTLLAYNRTVSLVNHTSVMALKYYNLTRNHSMKYYQIGRNMSMALYNKSMMYYQIGRNATLRRYWLCRNATMKYYSLGRNYTIVQYNRVRNLTLDYVKMTRNLTLFAYNVTRNFTLRSYNMTLNRSLAVLRFVNRTLVPKMREYILEGRLLVTKSLEKSSELAKFVAKEVREWYEKNKEKTVEELYDEVHSLARDMVDSAVVRVKDEAVKVMDKIQKLNTTVTLKVKNITGDLMFIFNQTINITTVSGKQLAAIFLPCAEIVQNRTMTYVIRLKNVSLPLLEKVKNTTMRMLNNSRVLAMGIYKELKGRKEFQELVTKYELDERFEMMVDNLRQLYKRIEVVVNETRPKVEARYKEAIAFLKVELPKMLSARREELMAKRDEIARLVKNITADPAMYAARLLTTASEEMMLKIKDTPIETVVMHEVWGQMADEIKQHEFFMIGGVAMDYTQVTAEVVVQAVMLKVETVQERITALKERMELLKKRAEVKAEELREKLLEGVKDLKKMKLREIVEHSYVYKTVAMVKNVTMQARNLTLQAKNATMKWIAVGRMYVMNITKNVTTQLQKFNATFQEIKRNLTVRFLALKKNVTLKFIELKNNLTREFLEIKKNVTLKYLELKKNVTSNLLAFKKNATLKYLEIKKNVSATFLELKGNVTLKLQELKKNVTLQIKKYTPILMNYTSLVRNMTIKYYKVARNWTVMRVNASKLWLNKTAEKCMKYCKDNVLPFYKEKLLPMYLNYSKIVVELSKNLTDKAQRIKEESLKAIMMNKPRVTRALQRFGKLTIRESIVNARNLTVQLYAKALNYTLKALNLTLATYNNYTALAKNFTLQAYNLTLEVYNQTLLVYTNLTRRAYNLTLEGYRNLTLEARNFTAKAYNYTLNMTRRAMNMTRVQYLAARLYLEAMKKQTLTKAAPLLALLNVSKHELVETVVFVSKYYGLQKNLDAAYKELKQELAERYALAERNAREVIKVYTPRLMNATSRLMHYANRTVVLRLVNQTIEYLNRTGFELINKTIRYLNHTGLEMVNSTVHYLNRTGLSRAVKTAVKYLNRTGMLLVNNTMQYINQSRVLKLVNKTIVYLNRTGVKLVNSTVRYLNLTVPRLVNSTMHYLNRSGVLSLVNNTIVYVNRTGIRGLVNSTIVYLNKTVLSLNQTGYYLVNKTITYLNQTGVLRLVNKTVVYLNRTGVRGFVNHTMVYLNKTIRYLNRTNALRLVNRTVGYLNRTGMALVNKTLCYLNRTGVLGMVNKTIAFVNKTVAYLNRTSALDVMNDTIRYLNHTVKLNMVMAEKAVRYLNRTGLIFVNRTVVYLNRTGVLKMTNKTIMWLNQTVAYLNRTSAFQLLNDTVRLLNRSGTFDLDMVHKTIVRLNRTGMVLVNQTIGYLNRTGVLSMVNKTIVFLNKTLTRLNRTCVLEMVNKTVKAFNSTMHALNRTLVDVRMALPKYIRVKNGMVSVSIPHLGSIRAVQRLRNLTVMSLNMTRQAVNASKVYLEMVKNTTKMLEVRARNVTMRVFNMTRAWTVKVYNLTSNMSRNCNFTKSVIKAYSVAKNATIRVYSMAMNVSMKICRMSKNMTLMRAFNMTRNMTMQLYNFTRTRINTVALMKVYNLTKNVTLGVYNLTKTKIYALSKDMTPLKVYNLTRNLTMKAYNLTKMRIQTLSKDINLMKVYNLTRNMTMKAYNLTMNITMRAYNRSRVVAMKVYKLVYNRTSVTVMRLYNMTYNVTMKAYNRSSVVVMRVYNMTYNMTMKVYKPAYIAAMKMYNRTYNLTMKAYNQTYVMAMKVYNKTLNMTMEAYKVGYNVTMKLCKPMYLRGMRLYNSTYNVTMRACNKTYIVVMKVYNRTRNMTMEFYRMGYNVTMKAYNKTLHVAMKAFNRTQNITMTAVKAFCTRPMTRSLCNETVQFYMLTKKYVREFNTTSLTSLAKTYYPVAMRLSREWCAIGYNSTRNFTLRAVGIAWYVSRDVYNSSSLEEALNKTKALSRMAYQQIRGLYGDLRISTVKQYRALYYRVMGLYQSITRNEVVLKLISDAREYLAHSRNMLKMRMRHLRYLRKHLNLRISHKMGRISALMNPVNWIPPFNSTAMIFGPSHVYTFDGKYYRFPKYKKADCMYVLARDVRDDKITLLSQERALLLVTEDMNVKIHQDGRVETMTKVTVDGQKIRDGYASELPVQSANTTVARYGSFVVVKNTIGLEIICDIEHDMCTFNIARWYHGRMAGLLGTNNNEIHDEWRTSDGKPAKNLIDFVNSWQVTKDPECRLTENDIKRTECPASRYRRRCREIFKDQASPLAQFFNVSDPKPFLKACEDDYTQCKTDTPKDMRHCTATAAYIDLLRMKGEWVEYLPECGRCAQHVIGDRWFQTADKMVDVVILVPETRSMRNFAQRLPEFVSSVIGQLPKYSFRFGVVAFGGENIHAEPHMVTVNGQAFGSAGDIQKAIDHLQFPSEPIVNNTLDDLEAMRVASRYPFRAGASKMFLLLSGWDRETSDEARLNRTIRMLKAEAITVNVLGKYKRLQNQKLGQDYTGRIYYKKGIGNIVPLPAGELVKIMKNTEGSVFGASFLATVDTKTFRAATFMNARVWKGEIERDQLKCRECFCAKGDAGQGRSICRVNALQKC